MSGNPLLTEDELTALLATHPQWQRDGDRLHRSFEFDNFSQAFAFMTRVAMIAEKQFHHPEWSNVYNKVEIAITDHDAGGLSTNDRAFVRSVDKLVD